MQSVNLLLLASPEQAALPKGVFFENARRRYRVRLYKYGRVFWRSYHHTLHGAMEALGAAKTVQASLENEVPPRIDRPGASLGEMLACAGYTPPQAIRA